MKLTTTIALLSLAVAGTTTANTDPCEDPTYQWIGGPAHGYNDLFGSACAPELAHPTLGLKQFYGGGTYQNFDSTTYNKTFLHTMRKFPAGVIGAELTIRVRPLPEFCRNDVITLRFINPFTGVPDVSQLWSRRLGTYSGDGVPGLRSDEWTTANYPNGHLFTLDLCALPLDSGNPNPDVVGNLIPYMVNHLDIAVGDDSAVDFASLKLTTCCGGDIGIYAIPLCASTAVAMPALGVTGCSSPGGVIDVDISQALPNSLAAVFVGLGQGSAPVSPTATIDVLPLIAGPIMLPVDAEGEFEIATPLPLNTATGVTITLQAINLDPNTGATRSTNAVSMEIK